MKKLVVTPMIYSAVIGDMSGSRRLPDRNAVQQRFIALIEEANAHFSQAIVSPFTVTIGDEFQVLLGDIPSTPAVIDFIRNRMAPVELVFGVGIGKLSTEINRNMAIGMDGPAFHHARQAVERAKKKKPSVIYLSDFPGMELANSLRRFIEACEKARTKQQKKIVAAFKDDRTQKEIGASHHITQQDVSKILKSARFYEVVEAERALAFYLEQIQSFSENNIPLL